MSVRDLIPWNRNNGNQIPTLLRDDDRDPFLSGEANPSASRRRLG